MRNDCAVVDRNSEDHRKTQVQQGIWATPLRVGLRNVRGGKGRIAVEPTARFDGEDRASARGLSGHETRHPSPDRVVISDAFHSDRPGVVSVRSSSSWIDTRRRPRFTDMLPVRSARPPPSAGARSAARLREDVGAGAADRNDLDQVVTAVARVSSAGAQRDPSRKAGGSTHAVFIWGCHQ